VRGPASYSFPTAVDELLPWSHAEGRLQESQYYWIATIRPNGHPHVTPLWGVWIESAFYFDGASETRWAQNLAQNAAMTLHLERGDDVVIVEGEAELLASVTDPGLAARIVADWDRKYGRLHPDPAGDGIFRLRPHTARAWSTPMLTDSTSWTFRW
jgi:nitroimidazol reductase NimA-like FMN-containing flavoprotein (pyridoxamine 5'-phosphate oxidase superfamily)